MTLATQRRGLFAGTAALEFALAAPILMFLGLAAVDLALTIDARLRLGEAEEGRAVLELLAALDPADSLGHRVLAAVQARGGRDVDYDDEPVERVP